VDVPGITTVFTLCDLTLLHQPAAHFPLRRIDQRAGYARFLRQLQRADRLLAISEATKRDAVERLGIPPERITVIPLAADERRFYPRTDQEIDAIVGRYGLSRPYFLHVGASVYHKNTANILRAFAQFCRSGNAQHALYIVGRWAPRPIAEMHAGYGDLMAAGRLRLLGFVPDDDLAALYGGANALVYPSLNEGFGLPVLEAMHCATPVLTSAVSSLPETGGDAALYVDPREPEEIAAAMRRLAGDPDLRCDLIERGLKRAAQFTWQHTAELTVQVYRELLP
jgi:glycosyltransferase involved in cell wall biosynthesis